METHKITSVVVVDGDGSGRRRGAPPRSLAHADVLSVDDPPGQGPRIRLLPLRRRRRPDRRHGRDARRRHRESKGFHIRDGAAIVWAQRAGPAGRPAVRALVRRHRASRRAARGPHRRAGRHEQAARVRADPARGRRRRTPTSPTWETTCSTCRCWRGSGLSAAPADAAAEVRERVDWVSTRRRRPRRGPRADRAGAARAAASGTTCCQQYVAQD